MAKNATERFWKKVEKNKSSWLWDEDTLESCWVWYGAKCSHGYGNFWDGVKYTSAHRFSWTIHNGCIPEGKSVLHACDNSLCVNPDHLFIGTQTDNIRDMIRKGRRGYTGMKGEKNPKSVLTWEDVDCIRESFDNNLATRAELARKYNVNWTTINHVVKRTRWI